MYQMYPDAWPVSGARRPQPTAEQPRRRARKEHSVVPAALTLKAPASRDPQVPSR